MAEFNEEDLRPFSSTSRPRTSAQAGPRPATGLRPKTGYRQQSGVAGSRTGTAMGARVEIVWSLARVMLYRSGSCFWTSIVKASMN